MDHSSASMSLTSREPLAALCFRVGRVFFLVLLVVLPFQAVSAAHEISMGIAALFLFLHLMLNPDRRFSATVLALPLALYTAAAALSLLSAVDFAYSLDEWRGEILKGILFYYLGVHSIQWQEHLDQSLRALLWGAGIMALSGVVLFFVHGGSLYSHAIRAGSLQEGYGGFGTYLVTIWPYLLLAPLAYTDRRWLPLFIGLVFVTACSAYLTYNRAAWLGMVVQAGLILVIMSRRRLRYALIGGGLCLGLVAVLLLLPGSSHGEKWSRLWNQPEKVGGTTGDLMAVWAHTLGEIKKHPWAGIGFGRHSFPKAYPGFLEKHHPLLWHAHNMFLDLALQLGLQGLATILLVLAVLIASLWPRAPPQRGDLPGVFAAATVVMIAGFCVRNLFDDFFIDDNALLFWLLTGLAMAAKGLSSRGPEKMTTSAGAAAPPTQSG